MIKNYTKKTKPAVWLSAFPEQREVKPPKTKVRSSRPRIRSESRLRAAQTRIYRIEARRFVTAARKADLRCPVVRGIYYLRIGFKYGHPISDRITEVHHMRGRIGNLLLDKRFWLGVSKEGHRWIHAHPKEARLRGWLCAAGKWNEST